MKTAVYCDVMSCSLQLTTRLHNTISENTAVFMILAVTNYGYSKARAPSSQWVSHFNKHGLGYSQQQKHSSLFTVSACHFTLKDKPKIR
jgi:hypothetical protein